MTEYQKSLSSLIIWNFSRLIHNLSNLLADLLDWNVGIHHKCITTFSSFQFNSIQALAIEGSHEIVSTLFFHTHDKQCHTGGFPVWENDKPHTGRLKVCCRNITVFHFLQVLSHFALTLFFTHLGGGHSLDYYRPCHHKSRKPHAVGYQGNKSCTIWKQNRHPGIIIFILNEIR